MNLHEFQAKQLLREAGLEVPRGEVVNTPAAAREAAARLGGRIWAVKAQVHAGGRGKAGGIRFADSLDAVEKNAGELLGRRLVTYQNAPEGQPVTNLLIEEGLDIAREIYLGLLVDRGAERIALVASAAGGMDIEEVARNRPAEILRELCDPLLGLQDYQVRNIAFALGLTGQTYKAFCRLLPSLYRVFVGQDLALLEINPLVVVQDDRVLPLDCKMTVDDNALYRQSRIAGLRDGSQSDPREAAAHDVGINYVSLSGNIGCMVNGAGLAMATMDLIKLHGGEPANFLDVGGGASAETVAKAFKILLADGRIKAVLVNIFGGIMRCDVIAEGIVGAVRDVGVKVPVVVRLEGTNVDQGKRILDESGLAIVTADDLTDAARRAVEAAR